MYRCVVVSLVAKALGREANELDQEGGSRDRRASDTY